MRGYSFETNRLTSQGPSLRNQVILSVLTDKSCRHIHLHPFIRTKQYCLKGIWEGLLHPTSKPPEMYAIRQTLLSWMRMGDSLYPWSGGPIWRKQLSANQLALLMVLPPQISAGWWMQHHGVSPLCIDTLLSVKPGFIFLVLCVFVLLNTSRWTMFAHISTVTLHHKQTIEIYIFLDEPMLFDWRLYSIR